MDDDDEEKEEEEQKEGVVTADRKIIDAPNDTAIQEKAIKELRKLQFTSGGGNC